MMNWILKQLIKKHDVITFDIFDTLIERKVLSPLDIFLIVGESAFSKENAKKFLSARKQAESLARKKTPNGEVTLDEIYACLPEKYAEAREFLKQTEILTEIKYSKKKNSMADVYKFAVNSGKTVYLISDMYLSGDIINQILDKSGIGGYKKCYISCEEHCNKISGELFKTVMIENGLSNTAILHIGDSFKADFKGARKAGVQSVLISQKNRLKRIWYDKSIRSKC